MTCATWRTSNFSTKTGLLRKIIEVNDVTMLNQYIKSYGRIALDPAELHDPFWIAAKCGSANALQVLLEYYKADPDQTQALAARGFFLLNTACQYAQLETARFLLDSDPPLGKAYTGDHRGGGALLSAAIYKDNRGWFRDRITRSEDLMHMLLDRGASVRDVVQVLRHSDDDNTEGKLQQQQWPLLKTVLGQAVSRASYKLLSRLIAEGADVHTRQYGMGDFSGYGSAQEVTALHIGSSYWNSEGVQALIQHRGREIDVAEMVSVSDSNGCLPLHWAAVGSSDEDLLTEDKITSKIISTFKLLIDGNTSTINIQDKMGSTALHYAVESHAACGNRHAYLVIKFLCENGADASLQDYKGQTVLHKLALRSIDGAPIDRALIELLLAHGANLDHIDADGNTALHIMARILRQRQAAQILITLGANFHAKNVKGNISLHEAVVGVLRPRQNLEGNQENVTPNDRIKAQDEIIEALENGAGDKRSLMDQPNAAGLTPRQSLEETRTRSKRYAQKSVQNEPIQLELAWNVSRTREYSMIWLETVIPIDFQHASFN
ncbi:ankyrin repeat-containing domain protein [Talaromyces proteolyticus]|uniref:Ankyrin repeat-containing domain protein n=1 Tax=Talaromyces proteolyticus TaxID=1131652 RepID=A0AAD4KPI6_9EURO|nr:ankyrin repeat-containing domain protein [Talaromyces proteolyticus]KAH8696474.1 ankyrin repeat-containing domain protein [Talaromyces proteolyticus]